MFYYHLFFMIVMHVCLTNNIHTMAPMEIDSEASYPKLLRKVMINEQNSFEALARDSNSLIRTHDWALQHDPQSLKIGYRKLIRRYSYRFCEDKYELNLGKRDDSYGSFCNILDRYAEIDPQDMKSKFYDEIYEHLFIDCTEIPTPSFPFALLHLLKKRDPDRFEPIKNKMLKNFSSCLCLALSHQQKAADLQDEQFNLHTLVRTGLTSKENVLDSLDAIASQENQEHSEFLEQKIIETLPTFFKEHYIRTSTLEKLLQSPSLKIRNSTLPALLLCITDNEQKQSRLKDAIDHIFEYEAIMPLQQEELYRPLFDSFQVANDYVKHYGTQRLIRRLAQDFITPFFVDVVSSYFNSPRQDPHPYIIDEAFVYALNHKTLSLSQLCTMLSTAQKTEFELLLNAEIVNHLKTSIILHECAPTKIRIQLFDELLINHHLVKGKSFPIFAQEIDQLPQSPFKQYARTLLIALDNTLHQTFYFAARAELFDLKKEHPDDFPWMPEILRRLYKPLFMAIEESIPKRSDHVEVNRYFHNPQFPKGPYCFGYVNEYNSSKSFYQLHACNKKTGCPIWAAPIESAKKHPYTITQDALYCVTDSGGILKINLITGDPLQQISINDDKTAINQLHAYAPEGLCAVHDNAITLIDLKTGNFQTIPLEKSYRAKMVTVGDKSIIPLKEDFFIINNKGNYQQIPHHSDIRNGILHIRAEEYAGTSQFIIYQKRDGYEKQSLVCLETEKYQPLWEQPLNDGIRRIQISPYDNTIFILTTHSLMALDPHADDEHRILWQHNLKCNIDDIHISQDASALYGIRTVDGGLYSLDLRTGESTFLYESNCSSYHHNEIVGDFDGKLYIQGSSC